VVVAALLCNVLRKFSSVDPSIDVHFDIEFLWSVAKDQGQHAPKRVRFSVAHDEFPFFIANWAVGAFEVAVAIALS
jgi:hypothetical protein